jgi:general secretion pathway protein J
MTRDSQSGITLVEILVALVIFALVGLASFTTLDTILRAQNQTDGRLDRLAEIDRSLTLFGRDLTQATAGTIGISGDQLTLDSAGNVALRYLHDEKSLVRESGDPNAEDRLNQILLSDIDNVSFRIFATDQAWHDVWPVAAQDLDAIAVELRVTLAQDTVIAKLVQLTLPVRE